MFQWVDTVTMFARGFFSAIKTFVSSITLPVSFMVAADCDTAVFVLVLFVGKYTYSITVTVLRVQTLLSDNFALPQYSTSCWCGFYFQQKWEHSAISISIIQYLSLENTVNIFAFLKNVQSSRAQDINCVFNIFYIAAVSVVLSKNCQSGMMLWKKEQEG